MHKKGFFFTLDAIMALTILAVGMFLLFSVILSVPASSQTEIIASDTMAFLSATRIEDLNDPYAGIGGTLWQQGRITKEKNTLLQQVGEFYFRNDLATAESFAGAVLDVPENHFAQLTVNGQSVYPLSQPPEQAASKDATALLIAKTEVVYGITNTSTFDIWGPYEMQLSVWQRQ